MTEPPQSEKHKACERQRQCAFPVQAELPRVRDIRQRALCVGNADVPRVVERASTVEAIIDDQETPYVVDEQH